MSPKTLRRSVETDIGDVPSDWDTSTLSDENLFSFETGLWTGKREPFMKAKVLRNTNFNNNGTLDFSDVATLDIEARLLPKKQLIPGDILIERSGGGPKQPIGRVVFFNRPENGFSFSNFTSRLRVLDKARIDPAFILHALLQFHSMGGTLRMQSNTTGIRNLNFEDYRRIRIPQPDIKEQRAIALILSKIQAAAEIQSKAIEVLKELREATTEKLFREGIRNESLKETEIGEIPNSWQILPLNNLSELLSGGTPSKGRADFWQGTIPWASPKDMKKPRLRDAQDHISAEALDHGSRLVPAKTIFIVIRGMILIKDVPIAMTEVPMAFNQDMKAVVPNDAVLPEFLLYALISRKSALTQEIGTSAHGTRRMGSISLETLLIPLPSKNEQEKIAFILASLERRIETAINKKHTLTALFSSMLNLLMTGQVRLKKQLSHLR